MAKQVTFSAVAGIPIIKPGDDIGGIILDAIPEFCDSDIPVVAQKVVSKAENRIVRLADVTPTKEAQELADRSGRDPRYCQVVLDESVRVLEVKGKVIVVEHRSGAICTSAGIDKSNLDENDALLLLPLDSDRSAEKIRTTIEAKTKKQIAVIISDSGGSPYRQGAIGEAIGFSGIKGLISEKTTDLFGHSCSPTINVVDPLCASASLLMGEAAEGTPIVLIRGFQYVRDEKARLRDVLLARDYTA